MQLVLAQTVLKHDTIGLIPALGYTCNNKYIKKDMVWMLHMEQIDGDYTVATGANTDGQNYFASVWTVNVSRPVRCKSNLAVSSTGTRVRRSETSIT